MRSLTFIEDSRVVTALACLTRMTSIHISACIPRLMTTTARQHSVNSVTFIDPIDAGNNTDAVEVYAMKLSVSPLLGLVGSDAVLLQEIYQLRFVGQFFRVVTFPNPTTIIINRVTVRSVMGSVNAPTVVEFFSFVAVAFSAGLQRLLHRSEMLTVMFCVAGGAGKARLAMFSNNGGDECFGFVTRLTVRIHFFFVSYTYADRMTRSTGVAVRLHGNRRRQGESVCGMRIRNRAGSKRSLTCKCGNR